MLASPAISANNVVRSAAVVLHDSCNYASTQLPATNAVIPHLRLGTQSYIVKSSAATDRPRDLGFISWKNTCNLPYNCIFGEFFNRWMKFKVTQSHWFWFRGFDKPYMISCLFFTQKCLYLVQFSRYSHVFSIFTKILRASYMTLNQSRQWVTGSDIWPTDPHKNWPMTHYAWPMTHRINNATTHFIKTTKNA